MLSQLGASPSSNSGLVLSSTEPHLKLVIASVDLCNERRNGLERGLAQCTATWVAGALRQPQGALTSARADALDRKSANRADFTANVVSRLPSTGVWRHSVKIFSSFTAQCLVNAAVFFNCSTAPCLISSAADEARFFESI